MVRALGGAGTRRGRASSRKPQTASTYAKKIAKDEARIDWTKSAARDRLPDPRPVAVRPAPGPKSKASG